MSKQKNRYKCPKTDSDKSIQKYNTYMCKINVYMLYIISMCIDCIYSNKYTLLNKRKLYLLIYIYNIIFIDVKIRCLRHEFIS